MNDTAKLLIEERYNELLQHARRHIRHDESAGDLPQNAVDPTEIVDEVVRQAESGVPPKPRRMHWLPWLYHLMHEELRRQRSLYQEKARTEVTTQERVTLPEDEPSALQPLEKMVNEIMEPEVTREEDVVPNPGAAPPDRAGERAELLNDLQPAIRSWPPIDREVFELYYSRGFEPKEIAGITGEPIRSVKERILSIQQRLRRELRDEAGDLPRVPAGRGDFPTSQGGE
jgi:RNA polymerase sigma factor (sigma-70 family)